MTGINLETYDSIWNSNNAPSLADTQLMTLSLQKLAAPSFIRKRLLKGIRVIRSLSASWNRVVRHPQFVFCKTSGSSTLQLWACLHWTRSWFDIKTWKRSNLKHILRINMMDSAVPKRDPVKIIKLEKEHELRFEVDFESSVSLKVSLILYVCGHFSFSP